MHASCWHYGGAAFWACDTSLPGPPSRRCGFLGFLVPCPVPLGSACSNCELRSCDLPTPALGRSDDRTTLSAQLNPFLRRPAPGHGQGHGQGGPGVEAGRATAARLLAGSRRRGRRAAGAGPTAAVGTGGAAAELTLPNMTNLHAHFERGFWQWRLGRSFRRFTGVATYVLMSQLHDRQQ